MRMRVRRGRKAKGGAAETGDKAVASRHVEEGCNVHEGAKEFGPLNVMCIWCMW